MCVQFVFRSSRPSSHFKAAPLVLLSSAAMSISAAMLLILLVFCRSCSATFMDIFHGLGSLLDFTRHSIRHNDTASSHQSKQHRLHWFGVMSGGTPWPPHQNAQVESLSPPIKRRVMDTKHVEIKNSEQPRLITVVNGEKLRTKAEATVAPAVTRPVEDSTTTAQANKFLTSTATPSLTLTTSTKSTFLTDLGTPNGENSANEALPDYVIFKPLQPLDLDRKPPSKMVPGKNDLAESTTNSSLVITQSAEPLTTTEEATSVTQVSRPLPPLTPFIINTLIPSTNASSTGESARESETLPDSAEKTGRNQLTLDINDIFQVIQ